MKFLIFLIVFLKIFSISKSSDDFYQEGPQNWFKKFPVCGENSQSPINIEKDTVKCEKNKLLINYLTNPIESLTVSKIYI